MQPIPCCRVRKDQGRGHRLPRVPRLRVPASILAQVHAHARAGAPQEVCGLLAGREDAQGDREIVHAFPVKNTHPRPVGEYQLDPQEQLRLTLHVEDELGLTVIGFYHSHPAGPARLSATDAARASWPGASYLLVHLAPDEGHLSARWDGEKGRFVGEEIEVVGSGD
ncbi:MAG: desampylase [Thermoplasmata archaeon]|jgi:proteasome lid subunit RPN8/RPN11|nr:desampylase [Thermoplasmata archaeon]